MNVVEVEEMDVSVHEEIHPTVRKIFDGIFEEPMREFNKPLDRIRENEYDLVWRDENERHDKIMLCAQRFIQALDLPTSFPSVHAEAAKHIEGSTCDVFLIYVRQKLTNSVLGQHPFEDSCKEVEELITKRILRIKETLETKHDKHPKEKSDIEIMISQTDLFDGIHIHHALLCCQIAYDCKDPEHIKHTLENLQKEHLLSELAVSYENKHVPKYVIARCGDVLYVSFKGIQSFNFGRTKRSYRGGVCSAFIETADKIPLQYFVGEIMQKKRIVFSGHSSGGAIASLVFLNLLEKFKIHQDQEFLQSHFKCITFGLMPLADNMFKEYIEMIPGAGECFCHIVLKNDIVPKLFGNFNQSVLQDKLWELVESVLKPTAELSESINSDPRVTAVLYMFLERGKSVLSGASRVIASIDHLDIFGQYYILDSSKTTNRCSVYSSKDAANFLRIKDNDGLGHIHSQYLVNHKLERYAHEVEVILIKNPPDFKRYKSSCNIANLCDISPQISDVRFESIGEQVVAKISGNCMWFIYNVSIDGVSGNGKGLKVDLLKSTNSEVQTRMREAKIDHEDQVSVRVKTHFENSKYLQPAKVKATTTTYTVSRRQQQLAKHRPRAVIELAFLSALLERHQKGCYSQRFKAIKMFFESAVSVVPVESVFHSMAIGTTEVVLQCCEIFLSNAALSTSPPSDFLFTGMELALERLRDLLLELQEVRGYDEEFTDKEETKRTRLVNDTASRIVDMLREYKKRGKRQCQYSLCSVDLEVIYPSHDNQDARKSKAKSCKAPITLLSEGRKELMRISDEIIAEHSGCTEESTTAKTNNMMLRVLNDLRNEFETCGTLLGTFMEARVKIPLEKFGGDSFVNRLANHAKSFGLSVWALLMLPFHLLNQHFGSLSKKIRTFVIEFSPSLISNNSKVQSLGHQLSEYDKKVEFILGSMKVSRSCNQNYISYSLERHLEDQCTKRKIFYHTPVSDILQQWQSNFEDETLTFVTNEFRPLVARWIKWSLMINKLRESLASQTAIGVIGLVNSGKSKFVRSMFGKETITGTTDQKRTTVPLIYNLAPDIEGMDVIDFPGVDDRDESIPELAELLLSLTRIIVFVVDYRRVHTESTKQWLTILARENVPVLICLTFADKLYAELMGENDEYDVEKVKSGIASHLHQIKEQIGQPKSGQGREFKLTVFAFDNDSKLNTDEGKEKLRKAGLSDELDVGRWIAAKLLEYDQDDVSQNVLAFIREKEKSTLNSNTIAVVLAAGGQSGDVSGEGEAIAVSGKKAGKDDQPLSSKSIS